MIPYRLFPTTPELTDALALMRASFAFMDGRIDPPSSINRLTVAQLQDQASRGEIWALGDPLSACVVLTPRRDSLYLGKLAVDQDHRGRGFAHQLVDHVAHRAAAHNCGFLELEVRVELTENQAAFAHMGFVEVARSSHPGFTKPTSVTMRRAV
ncbi:GNAT family N-acetyltransferase [Epibacterium ulvae]|uniref:GNAT family N-acetyltransferase n=1 Tax=Epibacterium ulvae TaxID=1156985 RepID=UPI001BFCB34C|nr:GNAT family N-acetyltransferase [Epibacterium ulvae]MBT8154789.1 GNAT family N-acetyltransferase [Epibacterium ulvae]